MEIVCGWKLTAGSNPVLCAKKKETVFLPFLFSFLIRFRTGFEGGRNLPRGKLLAAILEQDFIIQRIPGMPLSMNCVETNTYRIRPAMAACRGVDYDDFRLQILAVFFL